MVTHPRIYPKLTPPTAALEFARHLFARHLIAAPTSEWLRQGAAAWDQFDALTADDSAVRGTLVPDAHIAALCLANGAHLATRDRGFARFSGPKWFDPTNADPGR